jgi:hypothetical protein
MESHKVVRHRGFPQFLDSRLRDTGEFEFCETTELQTLMNTSHSEVSLLVLTQNDSFLYILFYQLLVTGSEIPSYFQNVLKIII